MLPGLPAGGGHARRPRCAPLHGPTSSFAGPEVNCAPLPLPLANERHVVFAGEAGVEVRDLAWPSRPGLLLSRLPTLAQCLSPSGRWLASVARNGSLVAFDFTSDGESPVAIAANAHPRSDLFFHPSRDDLFYLDAQQTLHVVSLGAGAGKPSVSPLGRLQKEFMRRQFSAGGNLLAVEASTSGRLDIFDLRATADGGHPPRWAQYVLSDQFAFCGEEAHLLELGVMRQHGPEVLPEGARLRPNAINEPQVNWPHGPTQSRTTRDGVWAARWKGPSAWARFSGPEFCLFRTATPQATTLIFGGVHHGHHGHHAYEDVAFDRQQNHAAAMFLDTERNEYGLYLVDLRTGERGNDIWTGQPGRGASETWSLQFSTDGAHLFARGMESERSGKAMAGFWLRVADGDAASLTAIAPAPRSNTTALDPVLYGHRRSLFVDPQNGVVAVEATHPAALG